MILRRLALSMFVLALMAPVSNITSQRRAQRDAPKDVRSKLFKQVLTDNADVRECLESDEGGARTAEEEMTATEVDLNHDGVPEYEVGLSGSCDCGMVNCTIYLYRKAQHGYELILDNASGFGLEVLKTSSNGFQDVRVTSRNNAATVDETTFKFDGTKYRESAARIVNQGTGESKPAYRRVQFKRGTSATTVQGRASIDLPDTYLIGARAGQVMTVTLTSPHKSVRFMIMSSLTTTMLTDSSRKWTGTLPETGDYQIVVDADEKGGPYSMTISIK